MRKKDFQKVANIIKKTKKRLEQAEKLGWSFNEIEFLIDEFAYWFEDENPTTLSASGNYFNEKEFRKQIYD
ncbi:hypothetical protein KY314_01670 [Candidatus Woesearchaeota archaeon]|nr:hypothetical protein [Candidatus Woesearchaeota archaeon]